jgi:phytoene/squalene synthetase
MAAGEQSPRLVDQENLSLMSVGYTWRPSDHPEASAVLAREITARSSRQTYLTIRWLADRDRTDDAFRAYAYFRWVDDLVDAPASDRAAKERFLLHQRQLLAAFLGGSSPGGLAPQEQMLRDLIAGRRDEHPGLRSYLENMMAVMEFDASRRGRLISRQELERYTSLLATGVWNCIEYFIGHAHRYPQGPARTQAVAGAHIIHMLRDTVDDLTSGYFNVPREVLEAEGLTPADLEHPAYRDWVRERVEQARRCFDEGKRYLRSIGCLRSQIASYLYCARFEVVLRQIELDQYRIRALYHRLPPPSQWWTLLAGAPRASVRSPGRPSTGRPV